MRVETDKHGRVTRWSLRASGSVYLALLLVGSVAGLWAGYLWPAQAIVKGQAPAILVPAAFFAAAILCWIVVERRSRARGWTLGFLVALGIAWAANLATFFLHGDLFTHLAWLLPVILLIVTVKPPSASEGIDALRSLAWAMSIVLVATFTLEKVGLLAAKGQPAGIIEFDEDYYWLPLNDLLGIEGRWPGPFGHNGYTAMAGAFLIVLAFLAWRWSSWVFLTIGAFALVVTSGRASAGAAATGIVVIAMLTKAGPLARYSRRLRLSVGGAVLVIAGIALFSGKSGPTGRQRIWPAFIDLWQTSPIFGVGTSGVSTSGGLTQEFVHAHNFALDLLARNGIIGLVTVFTALMIGLAIAIAAGLRGLPGPLAIILVYLVTSITEPRNDWIHPGTYVLMLVVCVLAAGGFLRQAELVRCTPVRSISQS